MKRTSHLKTTLVTLVMACGFFTGYCQKNILVNMAAIDGMPLTPDNILNYQIHASTRGTVQVKGVLRYRNSDLVISYSFPYNLQEGDNTPGTSQVQPQWQFSSGALQELFMTYKTLPQGAYEYCVTVVPQQGSAEAGQTFDECMFQKADDLFLINLVDPADDAKIREYNPMLSWVANYAFASELTYRLRIAEIKQGQNAANAIMRNQPQYDERSLAQNSLVYPVFAKPLEANKTYAWTVDAYYRNILLGGAENWKFTIIDDTVTTTPPATRSYIDVRKENGTAQFYILGEMKIKYVLEKLRKEELTIELIDEGKKVIGLKPSTLKAVYGDNRYELNLKENASLKHMKGYTLIVKNSAGERFLIPFKYLNPDFVK